MKTKRISSGLYQVGSFTIERVEYFESNEVFWNILENGEWQETLETLRECKEWVQGRTGK